MTAGWKHPRIANPDIAKDDWEAMAAEAARALDRRRSSYPAMIAKGTISQEDAQADLRAWEAIAADWQWIAWGEGNPANASTLEARIDALNLAISRFFEIIARDRGLMTKELADQGAIIAAMRWHAHEEDMKRTMQTARFKASIGHIWRMKNNHPNRAAIIAAQRLPERKAA